MGRYESDWGGRLRTYALFQPLINVVLVIFVIIILVVDEKIT